MEEIRGEGGPVVEGKGGQSQLFFCYTVYVVQNSQYSQRIVHTSKPWDPRQIHVAEVPIKTQISHVIHPQGYDKLQTVAN